MGGMIQSLLDEDAPFGGSASYYDALYHDKDYAREVAYVDALIQRYKLGSETLLEMGCGTGMHAELLADQGYKVHGFDFNVDMVLEANQRLASVTGDYSNKIEFHQGDMRNYRIAKSCDAVISLFHSICYQNTNADLCASFATAECHLKPGGLFIFDTWYGPAVLTKTPEVRIKRVEGDGVSVIRLAEPELFPNDNRVIVHYTYLVNKHDGSPLREIRESHQVRYLFRPEVEFLLNKANMDVVCCEEWLTGASIGVDTWGVTFVARKRAV